MSKNTSKVWMGLATVVPLPDNNDFNRRTKAFVNVFHLADSKMIFIKKVTDQLLDYGYILSEIEDIHKFDFKHKYNENLNDLAEITKETDTLQCGYLYTWDESTDNDDESLDT